MVPFSALKRGKGIFGAPMADDAAMIAPAASPDASLIQQGATAPPVFKAKRSFLDKLGLVADAFSNNTRNADMLAQRDREELMQFQSAANPYRPQQIGDSIVQLSPQTGKYEALYTAPKTQAYSEFERALIASGIQPGTPEWAQKMGQKADMALDPQVTTQLPNGGLYIGRQSGLSQALGGGRAAPTAPVGKLTPLGQGGAPRGGARTFPIR